MKRIFTILLCLPVWAGFSQTVLTAEQASKLARLPLNCLQQKYPYKSEIVLNADNEALPPATLHPAFYGCFDWHSSVHGHWALVKLLKLFPQLPERQEIVAKLGQNLTADNIAKEVSFFRIPNNANFERTYGWAWLLKLQQELDTWNDPAAAELARNLKPLADTIAAKYKTFLPKLNYPIRVGEHSNTAFGLAFAWDYAVHTGDGALQQLVEAKAQMFYGNDTGCPVAWEPGGFDFFSPCLIEADLMARIFDAETFRVWFTRFLPPLAQPGGTLAPALVTDRADPKLVHLDGLNFSRAWCLKNIAAKLPAPVQSNLLSLAETHLQTSLPFFISGEYGGEHWLVSFALCALTAGEQ